MLRINLLPIRQLQKRAAAVNRLVLSALAICGVILLLLVVSTIQSSIANNIRSDIRTLKNIKKKNAPILAEIKSLEKNKQELQRRISVIEKLKKSSSLTVRILDQVADRVDNERMWITSFQQRAGSLSLQGIALDNRSIADFMKALERSPYINSESVNLANSTLTRVANRSLKSFLLSCSVRLPQDEQPKKK